jgi:hypothetical protein
MPNGIKYQRIYVNTLHPDKTKGELIISTVPDLFTFGVSENNDQTSGLLTGFSLPICLWTKDDPTEEQKHWIAKFTEIMDAIKNHLVENCKTFGRSGLELRDLKKFNPLYYKKDSTGDIITTQGPVLYPKLIISKGEKKKR